MPDSRASDDSPVRARLPSSGCLFVATLLAVLVSVCLLIGWPVYQQQSRLEFFDLLGANYETKPSRPLWLSDLANSTLGADRARGFTDLTVIHLHGTGVTDAGLRHLSELEHLRAVSLINTRVSDSGLLHLSRLPALEHLWLGNTNITDEGLRQLSGLSNLEALYLGNTSVTDDGLRHLSGFSRLQALDLDNTQVTDTGLQYLYDLISLETLWLENTQVSTEGVLALRSSLPGVTIHR